MSLVLFKGILMTTKRCLAYTYCHLFKNFLFVRGIVRFLHLTKDVSYSSNRYSLLNACCYKHLLLCFTHITSFYLPNIPIRGVLLLFPFYS